MRIEISYKFIVGFLLVVASVVLMNTLVPHLGVQEEFQQLVAIASAIVIGLLLGVAFSKAFTVNIQRVNEGAYRLSRGDLSSNIELRKPLFADETVDLAAALNAVTQGLGELVSHIRSSSEGVAVSAHGLSFTSLEMNTSSKEVADSVEQISFGVECQAEMIETSSQLIKEVAIIAELVVASANKLVVCADDTAGSARTGGEKAVHTIEMMRNVLREIELDTLRMNEFRSQLQKIDTVVEIITGIANQANLLSFKAQAEVGRAGTGENGHGFAALADELRSMADSTNDSTAEITRLIETIWDKNQAILSSMTAIVTRMHEGQAALDVTSRSFVEIIENAATTQIKATSISELSRQQAEGVRTLVATIDEISKVAAENARSAALVANTAGKQTTSMTEMAQAAKYLNSLAADLMLTVSRFQLEPQQDSTDGLLHDTATV